MPVIEMTLPEGALTIEAKEKLVANLTETLMKWEGPLGNTRALAGSTLVYLHEAKEGSFAVAGKFQSRGNPARYRLNLSIPFAVLSPERKQGLVAELTGVVLEAEGAPIDDLNRLRVLCIIQEVVEGNWASRGQILGVLDLARLLGVDPTEPRYQELAAALAG